MRRVALATAVLAAGATGCSDGVQRIEIGGGETLALRFEPELERCEDNVLRDMFGDAYANGVVQADDADNPGPIAVRCLSLSMADNADFNRDLFRALGAAGWEITDGAANAVHFRKGGADLGVLGVPLPPGADERTADRVAFIFLAAQDTRPQD